jgi:Na+/H+ antiporter NhaD/arsenite permease-like protein
MPDVFTEALAGVAPWQIAAAAILFLAAYALVTVDRWNRAVVMTSAALLMILLGIIDARDALRVYVEWRTVLLFMGMMILAGVANRSGVFQYVAVWSVQRAQGKPLVLLIFYAGLTAVFSALLDNITAVMLIVPVTIAVARRLRLPGTPFLIVELVAANIGGVASLVGSPTNMMIGMSAGFGYMDFLRTAAPLALVLLVVSVAIIVFIYRRMLAAPSGNRHTEWMLLEPSSQLSNRKLAVHSAIVLGLTVLAFLLQKPLHLDAFVIAMSGAVLLLWIGVRHDEVEEELFGSVEWVTLFCIAGLYVLAGGLSQTGVSGWIAAKATEAVQGNALGGAMLILWVGGLFSAVADQLPFTAAMLPVVREMGAHLQLSNGEAALQPLWWALSFGVGLGGGGSLLGASANMVAAGLAMREGSEIRLGEFVKVGAPIALLCLAAASLYVGWLWF